MKHLLPSRGLLAVLLGVAALPAQAWDSICSEVVNPTARVDNLVYTGKKCESVAAARGRWRDPKDNLDEHRALMRAAILQAGLPASVLETVTLEVFTDGSEVDLGKGQTGPSLRPLPLDSRKVAKTAWRAFALDELAQLPDFSWSLADWAGGNEACPIAELRDEASHVSNPVACHTFGTHMGALNASHFPPQSDRWFSYMHQLALQRATECRDMRARAYTTVAAGGEAKARVTDARWFRYWKECELESLALEAVAQHYLQDSWSSGHMWERWGAASLLGFPVLTSYSPTEGWMWNALTHDVRRLVVAEMVALNAGTIHGSDPVMYDRLGTTLADAIGYPRSEADSAFTRTSVVALPVAGDMHLHDVLGDPLTSQVFSGNVSRQQLHELYTPWPLRGVTSEASLARQRELLLTCAAGSVREVFDRLASPGTYGAPVLGPASGPALPPPGPECDAPRVRNATFSKGFDATPLSVAIGEWFGKLPVSDIPSDIEARSSWDYLRAATLSQIRGVLEPDGTSLASLRPSADAESPMTMLGVGPNSQFVTAPGVRPALHADPPLPWDDPAIPYASIEGTPHQFLTSMFSRAHAPLWCAQAPGAWVYDVIAASEATRPARLRRCVELVTPQLRFKGQPSLCELIQPGTPPALPVDVGGSDPESAAENLCRRTLGHHAGLLSDDGLRVFSGSTDFSTAQGPFEVGSPRDAVMATHDRLFVTNGEGRVVGLRVLRSGILEMDLDPTSAATRVPIGTDARAAAFTSLRGHGWLFALDGGSDRLHVFDLGTSEEERFELCSVLDVGRDPSRVEGAWDVVITGDGARAFVSFNGSTGSPGDAIAMIDVLDAITCGGPHRPVTHVTGFGGAARLGAMALSPDDALLAVTGWRTDTCPELVHANAERTQSEETQVGCDDVWILRTAQLGSGPLAPGAIHPVGGHSTLRTRPSSLPVAVAWHPDGASLAYASMVGPLHWPRYRPMAQAGALALGLLDSRRWSSNRTYHAALDGTVEGEAIDYRGGSLYVGTRAGTLYAFGGPDHGFWTTQAADPDLALHPAEPSLGPWYGGCSTSCAQGRCPVNCSGTGGGVWTARSFGTPIRKVFRF